MQQADCSIVIDTTAQPGALWCAFEHLAVLEPGAPPSVIFVSACRLIDVYRLVEGRTNSDWASLFDRGGAVMVRIVATGEQIEIIRFARSHVMAMQPMPRCNLKGFNVRGQQRAVRCSNGVTYRTQREASLALGVSQSAISQHLAGKLTTVRGYMFEFTAMPASDAAA